jgi:hypothetical protein
MLALNDNNQRRGVKKKNKINKIRQLATITETIAFVTKQQIQ